MGSDNQVAAGGGKVNCEVVAADNERVRVNLKVEVWCEGPSNVPAELLDKALGSYDVTLGDDRALELAGYLRELVMLERTESPRCPRCKGGGVDLGASCKPCGGTGVDSGGPN